MKCFGKDRNLKTCRNFAIAGPNGDGRFCKFHAYMESYTPEMLENLSLCGGCRKMKYFIGEIRTCDTCRSRDKSIYKKPVVLCANAGCSFQRSVENAYCGKHQSALFIDETERLGKKPCVNHIRGCRSQLDPEYEYSKCPDCLRNDREKDAARRTCAKEKSPIESNTRVCTTCCREYPITDFVGVKATRTKTCASCRKQNHIQDQKRNREHRNELARKNAKGAYAHYKKDALHRHIIFEVSEQEFSQVIFQQCFYCGGTDPIKGFNGVDRVDSDKGYKTDNIVPCCSFCNYMKGTIDISTFLNRIEHILVINGIMEGGTLHPEAFGDTISGTYEQYIHSASSRNIPFDITKPEFLGLIRQPCYLCNKPNSQTHRNGIDRYDNAIGYTLENGRSCCGECNYMKHTLDYSGLLSKYKAIHANMSINENIGLYLGKVIHPRNKRFMTIKI